MARRTVDSTTQKHPVLSLIKKAEILVFILGIVLQNFAIIKTSGFGIALSTCILIFFFLRYRMYKHLSGRLILFLIVVLLFLAASSAANNILRPLQIARVYMIIFDAWVAYRYVYNLNNSERAHFMKVFLVVYMAMCVYGIYEFFAQKYGLPQFLNIFSNNPSYGARGIFTTYSGWSETVRIYGCFFEPAVYAVFLIYGFFLLIKFKEDLGKKLKLLLTILFLADIFLTFARTGYVDLLFVVAILSAGKLLGKHKIARVILKTIAILLPFILLGTSHLIGQKIFNDLSINYRNYSGIYYIRESLSSPEGILFGHGIGSLNGGEQHVIESGVSVENYAHNGYAEIMYQFGVVALIAIVAFAVYLLEKAPRRYQWLLYPCVFIMGASGIYYMIESIIITVAVLYALSTDGKYDTPKKVIDA